MKAIIVGGGIGGLTTALMLRARGIACELFEQTETIRELGVGINTLPHAIRELAGLGLLDALDKTPERFQNNDMIIVRYEGPSGAPGMPEMLDPTSRITTLCRERGIVVGLMTDARFSGGSVGLVIGHVGPEAALGGPIALVQDGDEIVADLNRNELNCTELSDPAVLRQRKAAWDKVVADNGGIHPNCGDADTRLLHRARLTAVPATRGGGLHPNREVWVRQPREAKPSGFVPTNKHRPETKKAF
jgi:dihydroxy-acid dehydratase